LAGPNQIGTPGEAKNLLGGAQKLYPTHFSKEGQNFFHGRLSPLRSS